MAAVEKHRLLCEKAAVYDFVKSDPLGVYGKEDVKLEAELRKRGTTYGNQDKQLQSVFKRHTNLEDQADGRPGSKTDVRVLDDTKPGRKRRKRQDDIFKSFGKETSNPTQVIDGKLKVNYKRFWNSDIDMGRWREALAHNKRHDTLMIEAREKSSENWAQEVSDLTSKHNALFRQRYAVDPKDLGKKSKGQITQLQDMQKQIQPKDMQRHGSTRKDWGIKTGRLKGQAMHDDSDSMRQLSYSEQDKPPSRTNDEEMLLSFIERLLLHGETLEAAFYKMDANRSCAMSFSEFDDGLTAVGWSGDSLRLFKKLCPTDGVVRLAEFMQLRPYMLKEMMRVTCVAKQSPHLEAKSSIWLRRAKLELAKDNVLNEVLEMEAALPFGSSLLNVPKPATASAPRKGRPGSSFSNRSSSEGDGSNFDSLRESCAAPRGSSMYSSVGCRVSSGGNTAVDPESVPGAVSAARDLQRQLRASERLPEMRKPTTISLYIFRNADPSNTGQAVFIGKVPSTMEKLLEKLSETVKVLVGPPESLLDNQLRPVRNLVEIENGGIYVLKGKETLDPPPCFFVPRPPLDEVRFKSLCEAQMAIQCEASTRPNTGLRPNTSSSVMSKASVGSLFSEGSCSRIGSMPYGPEPHPKPLPISRTWKAASRVGKELSYGGKNQPPTHKRYDLWTVVPRRAFSESSIDTATQRDLWADAETSF